jgi:CII-binding regulator of phage lambda lysogenization HflD
MNKITLQIHYPNKTSTIVLASYISIYSDVEGEISLFPQHINLNGIGNLLKYNDISEKCNFIFFIEHNILNVFYF